MCPICGDPAHSPSRRRFLGTGAAALTAPFATPLFAQAALPEAGIPRGDAGRLLIRGAHVLSMDPEVGDFEAGDVLVEDGVIREVGQSIEVGEGTEVIDATGRIVMPGFVDTHHHQFETALRGWLANGIMYDDGTPAGQPNYLDDILGRFAPVYRPDDVYISELFAGLSQLDAGVTTVHDTSQIHHSPEHSDAAVAGLRDAGRRAVFGYFEGYGADSAYPSDARRLKREYFSSDDQLLTMSMGGEVYLEEIDHQTLWRIGRDLDLPIAMHVVGSLGMADRMAEFAARGLIAEDQILIHMTGMGDDVWRAARDAGAHVSLAVPIEMNMRHGMPPIVKMQEMGMEPSLSVDVECTLTADFFTQLRGTMSLQRALVNEMALDGIEDRPELLTTRDVLRYATINGARGLRLGERTGSLTPGKAADLILLNAEALNVAPLNSVPGAVVSLMDRSNVESVMVAGRFRKWRGALVGHDIAALRDRLLTSRDGLFERAGVDRMLFE